MDLDICWLLLQHAERCLLDGESVLTVSSRQIRAELLGMGYGERQLTERDVRVALRSLIRRSQEPACLTPRQTSPTDVT